MESFEEAVRRGDAAAAAAFLMTKQMAQHVEEVEASIESVGSAAFVPSGARFRLQQQLQKEPRAWFYCRANANAYVFFTTKTRLQIDLIAWLYGGAQCGVEAVPEIPHTLAFLFYGLLLAAVKDNDADAIDLLLTSSTFCDFLKDDERRVVLEDAMGRIGGFGAETTISVLVAHGADIHADNTLPIYGARDLASVSLLRHLVGEGACFIGLQRVLHRMLVDVETLRELLRLGIDAREDAVVDLRGTASAGVSSRLEIVEVLLADGLVDVDAQDTQGRFAHSGTSLMRTVRGLLSAREDGVDDTLAFVQLLLRFGADTHVSDRRGFSAVDYVGMGVNDTLYKELCGLLGVM